MTDINLKQRFKAWGQAYAGEQQARTVYTGTETLAADAPAPDVNEEAAEIERIVDRMEQLGRWKESRVLRAEYFCAGLTEAERLQRLRRLGLSVSRTSYYVYLDAAGVFVLGALSQVEHGALAA